MSAIHPIFTRADWQRIEQAVGLRFAALCRENDAHGQTMEQRWFRELLIKCAQQNAALEEETGADVHPRSP